MRIERVRPPSPAFIIAMRIIAIDKDSPLFGFVRPGYRLLSINKEKVRDNLDCMYKLAEDSLQLEFEDKDGKKVHFCFDYPGDLGLTFAKDKILTCKCNCIFCFVHQQPKGMRRSLYVKDDDYRLSFTHGNFISLSNLTDDDIGRIVEQQLSPLYVSVHTTDDNLRRFLFKNKSLAPIVPQLKQLIDMGITFHTQVVVCPGINDGIHLERTIDDLFGLYPGVKTLGVVPVGLTRYRRNLPELRLIDNRGAVKIVDYLHSRQREFLTSCGSRFVFAADEFYVLSGRDLPRMSEYEEMEQFENGIGMLRLFLTDFNRKKRFLKNPKKKLRIAVLTGEAAFGTLNRKVLAYMKGHGFRIDAFAVRNHFWGRSVTVSGLLTGRDLLDAVKKIHGKYDIVLLPPNCLNDEELFLDDLSLAQFRKNAGLEAKVGSYSMIDTLKEVLN